MNSNQVYLLVKYAAGKNLEQGYVSPDDFNNVLMPAAQAGYLDYLLGEYQKYQAGRPIAVVEVGNKEKIRNSIAPLIYNTVLAPNTLTGIASYPSDYEASDAMWNVYGFYNIRFVNQPRLASFAGSSIDLIEENPVYLLKHEGFQFYPTNVGLARLSYVRTPPSIIWGYTLDGNGVEVWNPATSQDPVWADTDMYNIIARALRIIGVNLDMNTLSQYAQEIKYQGK